MRISTVFSVLALFLSVLHPIYAKVDELTKSKYKVVQSHLETLCIRGSEQIAMITETQRVYQKLEHENNEKNLGELLATLAKARNFIVKKCPITTYAALEEYINLAVTSIMRCKVCKPMLELKARLFDAIEEYYIDESPDNFKKLLDVLAETMEYTTKNCPGPITLPPTTTTTPIVNASEMPSGHSLIIMAATITSLLSLILIN